MFARMIPEPTSLLSKPLSALAYIQARRPLKYALSTALIAVIFSAAAQPLTSWLTYVAFGAASLIGAVLVQPAQKPTELENSSDTSPDVVPLVAEPSQGANDIHWEIDLEGVLTAAYGRLMNEVETNPDALIGQYFLDLVQIEDSERKRLKRALLVGRPFSDIQSVYHTTQGQLIYLSLSATPKQDAAGKVSGYVGVGTNVTERVLNERRLRQLAEKDTLTGLANRHRFNEQIERDLKNSEGAHSVALLAIDLDGFKQVNDTYGHQAGDALLNLFGKRLRGHVRNNDWAARLGGDEFMVVSNGIKDPMDACQMAARLLAVLSQPYHIGGVEVQISASIGIACAPIHARNAEDLMKYADLALYKAKAEGRNRFSLYQPSDQSEPLEITTLH